MISLYIIVFLIITISAIIAYIYPKYDKQLYYISFIALTAFLCLRFGQGTDWPGYMRIFNQAEYALNPEYGFRYYHNLAHSEIGWKFLMVLFNLVKFPFWVVTSSIGLLSMLSIHLGIKSFNLKYKTMALVLLYPTIYLTYFFSGIRQGLVMSIFFGVLLKKLIEKKYAFYLIGVIILSTLHKVSLIYLIVPIVLLVKTKYFKLGFFMSLIISILLFVEPIQILFKNIATLCGISVTYFDSAQLSIFSLGERVLMLLIILVLWHQNIKNNTNIIKKAAPFMRIYFIGFIIYICLCSNTLISSRVAIMFKMSEVFLIPLLLECEKNKISKMCFTIVFCVSTLMMYKNLEFYAGNDYEARMRGYNLPYISVFNQDEIWEYRERDLNNHGIFKE